MFRIQLKATTYNVKPLKLTRACSVRRVFNCSDFRYEQNFGTVVRKCGRLYSRLKGGGAQGGSTVFGSSVLAGSHGKYACIMFITVTCLSISDYVKLRAA